MIPIGVFVFGSFIAIGKRWGGEYGAVVGVGLVSVSLRGVGFRGAGGRSSARKS